MRTRADHLKWCKERAHEYLAKGEVRDAVASMMSDLTKHPELGCSGILGMLGIQAAASGDIETARRYIDGFI